MRGAARGGGAIAGGAVAGGAGAGGAAGIEPIAMVVVHKGVKGPEGVKVMSLKAPDPLTRAIGELSNAAVEIISQGSKMMMEKGKKKEAKIEGKKGKAKFESNKNEAKVDIKEK